MYIYCVTYTSELITRGANTTTNPFLLGERGNVLPTRGMCKE